MTFPLVAYVIVFIVSSLFVVTAAEQMGFDFEFATTDAASESPPPTSPPSPSPAPTEAPAPGPTSPTSPTTTVTTTTSTTTTILITAQRLQTILQKEDAFTSLPADSRIALGFFDGNGNPRPETFLVSGGGQVTPYEGNDYDVKLTTGDYYIDDMEATDDLCGLFTELKNKQEVLVDVKNALASLKYVGLSSCVPFT